MQGMGRETLSEVVASVVVSNQPGTRKALTMRPWSPRRAPNTPCPASGRSPKIINVRLKNKSLLTFFMSDTFGVNFVEMIAVTS